jgi:hypothetical protein
MQHRDVGCEPLRPHELRRCVDDAPGHVDPPAVVDALQAVAVDTSEHERRAPVGAQLVEEADPPVFRSERHVALAQEPDRHRAVAVDEVRRERERDPAVVAHQAAHRGVAVDPGHQLVLGLRDHRSPSLDAFGTLPRPPGQV